MLSESVCASDASGDKIRASIAVEKNNLAFMIIWSLCELAEPCVLTRFSPPGRVPGVRPRQSGRTRHARSGQARLARLFKRLARQRRLGRANGARLAAAGAVDGQRPIRAFDPRAAY